MNRLALALVFLLTLAATAAAQTGVTIASLTLQVYTASQSITGTVFAITPQVISWPRPAGECNQTPAPAATGTVVNPSRLQNDLAVTRTFKVGSTQNLQFRWEIFNVINKVNYNAPITSLNSASFGQIQSAADPRIMQFALKVDF